MFIFEYGLLKLHLLREKISILIEERLHMRGDRFFFNAFTLGVVGMVFIY